MTDPVPPDSARAAPLSRSRHNRALLILIFFIALVPVLAAWGLYHWSVRYGSLPQNNYGELITPPKPVPPVALLGLDGKLLPADAFTHHWSLIYIGGASCDAACAKRTYEVHNFRALLQEQYKRLRVFYLAPGSAAMEDARKAISKSDGMPVMVRDATADGTGLAAFFGRPAGTLVLVDPAGRWMLAYPPGFSVEGAYKDLRHLLRYSQLG